MPSSIVTPSISASWSSFKAQPANGPSLRLLIGAPHAAMAVEVNRETETATEGRHRSARRRSFQTEAPWRAIPVRIRTTQCLAT